MTSDCAKTKSNLSKDKELVKNKKCKPRLFIGEGDFSYTEALINKYIDTHKQLARAIVATELNYIPEFGVDVAVLNQRTERVKALREKGVKVLFGIDGRELHNYPELKGQRFKRIHWNCPFRWSTITDEEFIQVIADVFSSCNKIQLKGDRVHISVVQSFDDEIWYDWRQHEHNVVKGSVLSGYKLIRKRRFGMDRYPGYQHRRADDLVEYNIASGYREFIFEKDPSSVPKTENEVVSSLPMKISNDKKTYIIDVNKKKVTDSSKIGLEDCYFVCSTDDESSDYYDSSDIDN